MKQRSRTGCQKCRTRRIKCDEARPVCANCARKSLPCTYETCFRWIQQDVGFPSATRKGPVSRRRQRAAKSRDKHRFKRALAEARGCEMVEVAFRPQDEPVTELNGPGSLTQFKKFLIRARHQPPAPVPPAAPTEPPINPTSSPSLNGAGAPAAKKNPNVALPVLLSAPPREPPVHLPQICDLDEPQLLEHFLAYTADTLVPVPYEESPFLLLLPQLAATDPGVRAVLAAYGATHMLFVKRRAGAATEADANAVQARVDAAAASLHLSMQSAPDASATLLCSTVLARIEAERNRPASWRSFLAQTVQVINSKGSCAEWDLTSEANSTVLRLAGAMCALGNLAWAHAEPVPFPLWPEWAGSVDFLTGFDLNYVQFFGEAAALFKEHAALLAARPPGLLRRLADVHRRALRVTLLLNDFWLESYLPDSDVSALCILVQEALKLHLYRRLFRMPRAHANVQGLARTMAARVERWIAPASTIHRHMSLTLVTLAVECLDPVLSAQMLARVAHLARSSLRYAPSFPAYVLQIRDEGGLDSEKFYTLLLA